MKVLIIRNNTKVELADDIKSAFDFLSAKTPIKYELSYLTTDFMLQYKDFGVGKYWGTTGTKDLIKPLLKEKYDAVIFLYGVNGYTTTGGGTLTAWTLWEGITPDTEYVEIPCSPFGDAMKWIDHAISHEMVHVLCKKANKAGFQVTDEMDITKDNQAYLHNDDPNHVDGNYARTLKNLEPYFKSLRMKEVIIIRDIDTGKQTLGTLYYLNMACKTLERSWVDNKPNISCIPKGEYICKYTFSPKFMKYTYEIQKVPGRSGIRFHEGSFFWDILGCIILGEKYKYLNTDDELDIVNTRATIQSFEGLMGKQDFKLTIK